MPASAICKEREKSPRCRSIGSHCQGLSGPRVSLPFGPGLSWDLGSSYSSSPATRGSWGQPLVTCSLRFPHPRAELMNATWQGCGKDLVSSWEGFANFEVLNRHVTKGKTWHLPFSFISSKFVPPSLLPAGQTWPGNLQRDPLNRINCLVNDDSLNQPARARQGPDWAWTLVPTLFLSPATLTV